MRTQNGYGDGESATMNRLSYHFPGDGEKLPGYIAQMRFELSDDDLVVKTLQETHAPEHLCLALLMVQFIRCDVERKGRAVDYLQAHAQQVADCLHDTRPTPETLFDALNFYGFLSVAEKARWVAEAMGEPFMAENKGRG